MKIKLLKIVLAAASFLILLNACKKSSAVVSAPSVSTINITAITTSTSSSGGIVNGDGGSAVTAKGVCYSTSAYPSIVDAKTNDGTGTDQFTSSITSLDAGTLYFVRAYATNGVATSYGNQVSFKTLPVAIGDNYRGGIVAYVLKPTDANYSGDKEKGLIASPTDQSSTNWGAYVVTGATATNLGSGDANTTTIASILGAGTYAARVCADLTITSYTDWYLPSIAEMNELYLNKDIVGGFTGTDYWTSSEYNSNLAWSYDFTIGSTIAADKLTASKLVRAIRSF